MIRSLTVLYDADCPTCVRLRQWLVAQPQLVPLHFVPAGSPEARVRFVGLDHEATRRQITVVADDGSIYRHDRAMLVCLWALARWRGVALHAGSPWRRPFVKLAAAGLDRWRRRAPADAYRGSDVAPPPFEPFGPGGTDLVGHTGGAHTGGTHFGQHGDPSVDRVGLAPPSRAQLLGFGFPACDADRCGPGAG